LNETSYYLFLVMATVTVLSPGPGVLMTVTNALSCNRRDTFAGVLGIAAGALVVAAISATSVGVLLATAATALMVLKLAGAAYLVYLGVRLWRSPGVSFSPAHAKTGSAARRFVEGMSLQLSNPKAILFFVSVFPQFIDPGQHYLSQFATLVVTYSTLVVVLHSLYAAFAQRAKTWFSSRTGGRIISRLAGCIFVLFGAALAMSEQRF
jgi:homoserine/homoserine lactone efflux protein